MEQSLLSLQRVMKKLATLVLPFVPVDVAGSSIRLRS